MAEIAVKGFTNFGESTLVWTFPDELTSNPEITPIFPLIWESQLRMLQKRIEETYPDLPVSWERGSND